MNPHSFDEHKLQSEEEHRRIEMFNSHQADTRARVDTLAKLIFAVSGGALTVTAGLFLRETAPPLSVEQASDLRATLWCLFGGMAGFALVIAVLILQAQLLATAWRPRVEGTDPKDHFEKWGRRTEWISWAVGLPAFFSFIAGLAFLATLTTSLVHEVPITSQTTSIDYMSFTASCNILGLLYDGFGVVLLGLPYFFKSSGAILKATATSWGGSISMAGEFVSQRVDVSVGSLFLLVGFVLQFVDAAGFQLLPIGAALGYFVLLIGPLVYYCGGRKWMIGRLMDDLKAAAQ